MTRDEANRLIQQFFRSRGGDSPGLNSQNLGGAFVGESQIYFQYDLTTGALKCSALIYKFHAPPRPGVIERFKAEEVNKTADTGGGTVDYEPENKGLYLSRTYIENVSDEEFSTDLERLMKASFVFGDEVLERVASKAADS